MTRDADARCKVCGARATFLGAVDMNKACETGTERVFPASGITVDYLRCDECHFVFTTHFDGWSTADWLTNIYNADYIKIDPEYDGARAERYAKSIASLLGPRSIGLSMLDYGGGNGHMAEILRGYGFSDVSTYEPFNPAFAAQPTRKFNVIICIEVFEHHPSPKDLIHNLSAWLEDEGLVIFSTGLYSPDTEFPGASWWYIAPRNGHISIFSPWALDIAWRAVGFHSGTIDGLHLAFKQVPRFAQHVFA